jgi:hypothetical protein
VHGPLIHTLLVDGLRRARPEAKIASVSVRAVSPLYAGAKFTVSGAVEGNAARLWAVGRPAASPCRARRSLFPDADVASTAFYFPCHPGRTAKRREPGSRAVRRKAGSRIASRSCGALASGMTK